MSADSAARVLAWSEFAGAVDLLAAQVQADPVPDVVVGVLRGGMVPAVMLAHRLGVRTVRALEVLHTTGDGPNAAKTASTRVANAGSIGRLAALDVLVVDDIAGSGDTVADAADLVRAAGAARVRTAVCFVNIANWRRPKQPSEALTYHGVTVRGWVVFPWETQ